MSFADVTPPFDDLPTVSRAAVSPHAVGIAGGLTLALLIAASIQVAGASRREAAAPGIGACKAPVAGRDSRIGFLRSPDALPGLPDLVRLLP